MNSLKRKLLGLHPEARTADIFSFDVVKVTVDTRIATLCDRIGVTEGQAVLILLKCKWCVNAALEACTDTDILDTVLEQQTQAASTFCPICYKLMSEPVQLCCGHNICETCLQQYLEYSLAEGEAALETHCPLEDCGSSIPKELFQAHLGQKELNWYMNYLYQSYLCEQKKIRWCETPGCCFGACAIPKVGARVVCGCKRESCFDCGQDWHFPLRCNQFSEWQELVQPVKDSSSSDIRGCPSCSRLINKTGGCMHMTCRCGYHFCWECGSQWTLCHPSVCSGTWTGTFLAANVHGPDSSSFFLPQISQYVRYRERARWLKQERQDQEAAVRRAWDSPLPYEIEKLLSLAEDTEIRSLAYLSRLPVLAIFVPSHETLLDCWHKQIERLQGQLSRELDRLLNIDLFNLRSMALSRRVEKVLIWVTSLTIALDKNPLLVS